MSVVINNLSNILLATLAGFSCYVSVLINSFSQKTVFVLRTTQEVQHGVSDIRSLLGVNVLTDLIAIPSAQQGSSLAGYIKRETI